MLKIAYEQQPRAFSTDNQEHKRENDSIEHKPFDSSRPKVPPKKRLENINVAIADETALTVSKIAFNVLIIVELAESLGRPSTINVKRLIKSLITTKTIG